MKILLLIVVSLLVSCSQFLDEPCISQIDYVNCTYCGTSLTNANLKGKESCIHGSIHAYCAKCGSLNHFKPLNKCN